MNWMEVALLILGVGAFVASFIIPDKKSEEQIVDIELVRKIIDKEMQEAKTKMSDMVDETVEYAVEKTERASERISNEKIMAINEYSDTVLADVNKTHQEVMFLYDMLNDKHKNLKETALKVDKQAKEAEQKVNAAATVLAATEETSAIIAEKIDKKIDEKIEEHIPTEAKPVQKITLDMIAPKQNVQTAAFVSLAPMKKEQDRKDGNNSSTDKKVEVYSFAQQAPKVERPVNSESQAKTLERTVVAAKSKEAQMISQIKKAEEFIEENNNDKILRLYKVGMSSVDIAKELGLGVGEVKLVINLFKGAV